MEGAIYGKPGGSLKDASWLSAGNQGAAKVGAAGEVRTAAILDRYAKDGSVTILHDLKVPSAKYKANIDHIVVSGNRVFPIDAKVWKPGWYWTFNGQTRRGFERFTPAEKQTMAVIERTLTSMFEAAGVDAVVEYPWLLVWPSSKRGKLTTWALKVPGANVYPGDKIERVCKKHFSKKFFGGGKPADQRVVDKLLPLLLSNPELSDF